MTRYNVTPVEVVLIAARVTLLVHFARIADRHFFPARSTRSAPDPEEQVIGPIKTTPIVRWPVGPQQVSAPGLDEGRAGEITVDQSGEIPTLSSAETRSRLL
ncbi:hypothetical protein J6590_035270 [Homalodisca vitripennis]|nr:hypothetical protein J6590_035270 [Homalodisca vitripennis]